MTIATQTNKALYSGDGVQTVFPYTFKIFAASDMVVIRRAVDGTETNLTLTTHFTVSGVGSDAGGDVTLVGTQATNPPAVGEKLLVKRVIPLAQETDWTDYGPFPAETIEGAIDRLTCIDQQLQEQLDRALKAGATTTTGVTVDPDAIAAQTLAAQTAATQATAAKLAAETAAATLAYPNKGDIKVGTGSGGVDTLPVGTDGQVLVADSGQAAGVKYVTLPPGTSPWGNEFYS